MRAGVIRHIGGVRLATLLGLAMSITCLGATRADEAPSAAPTAAPSSAPAAAPLPDQTPTPSTAQTEASAPDEANAVYAIVNDESISMQEYIGQLATTLRKRFYHGKVPDDQLEAVRREVSDSLIERMLLLEESKRRGIEPDAAAIDQTVAEYDARYGDSTAWKEQREQRLPALKAYLARQNVLEQLEKQVRSVPTPTPEEVRAYYDTHPDLFTEPEKVRLSAILLKAEPGATRAVRDQVKEEAQAIYKRLAAGADFAEEARLHSKDESATRGGDLGYLHRGMLPEALHAQIDEIKIGVVAEPIGVLEGVAIFRLDERVAPRLRDFADVAQQAQELLIRERAEQAWKGTISRLRETARIQILAPGPAAVSEEK